MNLVFGIILLVSSVFLIIAVLMQSGKSHNLSGTIAGGAETFFGKTKGKTVDKILSKLTTAVSIIFVVLVIVVYIFQPDTPYSSNVQTAPAVETTAAVSEGAETFKIESDTVAPAAETQAPEATTAA